jgi:hypothetical protein
MFFTKTTTDLYWKIESRLGKYAQGEDDEERARRSMRDFSLLSR